MTKCSRFVAEQSKGTFASNTYWDVFCEWYPGFEGRESQSNTNGGLVWVDYRVVVDVAVVADSDGFVVVLVDTVKGVYWLCDGKRGKQGQKGEAGDKSPPTTTKSDKTAHLCRTGTPPPVCCTFQPWPASQCGCHGNCFSFSC